MALCASSKSSKSHQSVLHRSWGQMGGAGLPALQELERELPAEAGSKRLVLSLGHSTQGG